MNPLGAVLSLALITGALLMLPLVPALRELRTKSDAMPLSVIQQHAGEIRFFADGFRSYLKPIEPALRECIGSGGHSTGTMADGSAYLVLGRGEEALYLPFRERNQFKPVMIASGGDLLLPSETHFSRDIYSTGSVIGGTKNRYRAILAEKDVRLGAESSVMRWVHAVGEFGADPSCNLYGRVSSDKGIRLSRGCGFQRLNAPYIAAGSETDATENGISSTASATTQRVFHDGDFEVQAGQVFLSNLVVRGNLRIGTGAVIRGSVKSERELILESGVSVEGSLISSSRLEIGAGCKVHGPVIAERTALIKAGSCCGTLLHPTTVSAPNIEIDPGVIIFGTLWAREQGQVTTKI